MEESSATAKIKLSKIKPQFIIAAVAIVAVIAVLYYYNQYTKAQALLQSPNLAGVNQQEKDLVVKIGKLMELPTDEVPTIASVKDKSQLPNIPLFANAQNGDQVLVYAKAQKAILYRPSENKIVDVSPVTISSPTLTPTPVTTAPQAISPTPVATENPSRAQ